MISIIPISISKRFSKGDDLSGEIIDAVKRELGSLKDHDIVVITQKVVSKVQGRTEKIDHQSFKRWREELIRKESKRILRKRNELFITETKDGFVCANAGIDFSNVEEDTVSLLPKEPDRIAGSIRAELLKAFKIKWLGVIISDTFGRPFRNGVCDVAIGLCGIKAVLDLRKSVDAFGRPLEVTQVCIADELASCAELAKPKNKLVPVVVIRGADKSYFGPGSAKDIVRKTKNDLFR